MKPSIVGIRFQKTGKLYHFDGSNLSDLQMGDFVLVDTSRGRQIGEIIQFIQNPAPPPEGQWKTITRKATARDMALRQLYQKKELEATINCRAKLAEIKLSGVKIISSEYSFDGSRLSIFYSTEDEAKIDLKNLRNAMQRIYPKSRVEMHQIGPRDVAKLLGGMGACGLETRCCSMFLTDFSPISIKMAKEQGISLTPEEITGMCGRLRCCLVYEYEQYVEARKSLPKRNKRVVSPQGEGQVIDTYPLRNVVVVELDNGTRAEFPADDLQPWDEMEALRRKSQEPCDRHENGECSCGKKTSDQVDDASFEEEIEEADFGQVRAKPAEAGRTTQPPRRRPSEPYNKTNKNQPVKGSSQPARKPNQASRKQQPPPKKNTPGPKNQ
jgi:cell fate regulator YaaT (PSP1 superfamily)